MANEIYDSTWWGNTIETSVPITLKTPLSKATVSLNED